MTQEDKKLLLKDLCARFPYRVKCRYYDCCEGDYYEGTIYGFEKQEYIQIDGVCIYIEEVMPYLSPMSSMTEEQKKEYEKVCELDTEILEKHTMDGTPFPALYNSQDWLNAHHFDYRNLINKNLAIDCTNLNIY